MFYFSSVQDCPIQSPMLFYYKHTDKSANGLWQGLPILFCSQLPILKYIVVRISVLLHIHMHVRWKERNSGKNSTTKSEYSNWSVVYGHNLSLERQMNFKHSFFVDGKICVLGCRIIWIFLDPPWFVLTSPSEIINLRI